MSLTVINTALLIQLTSVLYFNIMSPSWELNVLCVALLSTIVVLTTFQKNPPRDLKVAVEALEKKASHTEDRLNVLNKQFTARFMR